MAVTTITSCDKCGKEVKNYISISIDRVYPGTDMGGGIVAKPAIYSPPTRNIYCFDCGNEVCAAIHKAETNGKTAVASESVVYDHYGCDNCERFGITHSILCTQCNTLTSGKPSNWIGKE